VKYKKTGYPGEIGYIRVKTHTRFRDAK